MKKVLLIGLAATAMLASCSNDETVEMAQQKAIGFSNVFVDNATRASVDPSLTNSTIDHFYVWGVMKNGNEYGKVFNKEEVSKTNTNNQGDAGISNTKWGYTNIQYWTNHEYYFAALTSNNVADENNAHTHSWSIKTEATGANLEKGIGTIEFTNNEGTEDLLYAAEKVDATQTIPTNSVKFTFNHLLSKVKFTFTNGFNNDNATISVSDIKMTVPKSGTINLAQDDWWSTNQWTLDEGNTTTTLSFGNMVDESSSTPTSQNAAQIQRDKKGESYSERLTIPAASTQSYVVTFTATLYQGGVEAYKANLQTTISGAALEIGKAYNFHATLNADNIVPGDNTSLSPITFTVESVKNWDNGNTYEGNLIETTETVTE